MKNWGGREKVLLGLAVAVMAAYLVYLGPYLFYKQKRSNIEKKIQAAETQLKKNFQIIEKSRAFAEHYRALLEDFRQKGSDEQIMASMLSEVETVANQLAINIPDKKPRKARKIDFYNYFSVGLSLEGELEDVMRFLHTLQKPPHLLRVDEIEFSNKSYRETILKCQIVLSRTLIP